MPQAAGIATAKVFQEMLTKYCATEADRHAPGFAMYHTSRGYINCECAEGSQHTDNRQTALSLVLRQQIGATVSAAITSINLACTHLDGEVSKGFYRTQGRAAAIT
jgi:hypothetical protein